MPATEELDLTLSLRCGTSRETPTPSLRSPNLNLSLSDQSPGINPSLMEVQLICPNPNLNSPLASDNNNSNLSVGSSRHNTNSLNAPANVDNNVPITTPPSSRSSRASSCTRPGKKRKRETVPPPFPWATDQPATVHTQQYLLENNVRIIKGKVHCKRCNKEFELNLNLEQKLADLRNLIQNEVDNWHNRAPSEWLNPVYPTCVYCRTQSSTKPIIAKNKKEINWLFLLLGQMLGCCTLDHLKYFCEHNNIHRTGAKDRLLYVTYIHLVKQLLPDFSIN